MQKIVLHATNHEWLVSWLHRRIVRVVSGAAGRLDGSGLLAWLRVGAGDPPQDLHDARHWSGCCELQAPKRVYADG
jgi:hypothetical protein